MPTANRVKTLPVSDYGEPDEHIRRICQTVNGMIDGQGNAHEFVTLAADETETTVSMLKSTSNSGAALTAMSATAAAATGLWSEAKAGEVVIHHDSTSDTDRLFLVALYG